MRQKIDCFLACRSPHDIEQTLAQLRGSRTIQHINIVNDNKYQNIITSKSGILKKILFFKLLKIND